MGLMDKYIKENKKEKILVQAHLDSDIVEFANNYKSRHKISWTKLITAMLKRLEDEERGTTISDRDRSKKAMVDEKQQSNTSSRKQAIHGKAASPARR